MSDGVCGDNGRQHVSHNYQNFAPKSFAENVNFCKFTLSESSPV